MMARTFEISFLLIVLCFVAHNCEVIIRKSNSHEGSVCFFKDKQRGVCRFDCPGQRKIDYQSEVCNDNGTHSLYCCIDNDIERKAFPTIDKVCMDQRLDLEFYEQLKEDADETNRIRYNLYEEYDRHYKSVIKDCDQQALNWEEDERETRLEKCLKVPQKAYPPSKVEFRPEYSELQFLVQIGLQGAKIFYERRDERREERRDYFWTCTGALIHKSYVLTTKDCSNYINNNFDLPIEHFGVVQVWANPRSHARKAPYRVVQKFYPDEFDEKMKDADIAILQIESIRERTSVFNYDLKAIPICIWTKTDNPSSNHSIAGFVDFSFKKESQAEFFNGTVTFLRPEECKISQSGHDHQTCVVVSKLETKTSCTRNFGMPTFISEQGWFNVPYLTGMAARGWFCELNQRGFVENIHPYLEWIEKIISGNH